MAVHIKVARLLRRCALLCVVTVAVLTLLRTIESNSLTHTTHRPVRTAAGTTARNETNDRLEQSIASDSAVRPFHASRTPLCTLELIEMDAPSAADLPQSCRTEQRIRCTKKLGRALVLYMVHTKKPRDVVNEMQNFQYFARYGVYGPEESTELFSGVDYIFTRMRPNETEKVSWNESTLTTCSESSNVKLMWVSNLGADLCAHFKVFLEELGGLEAIRAKYAYVVYMNSGARGPFQSSGDASWIDVFAMGGLSEISDPSQLVVSGPTISTEQAIHVQSYVIGVPTTNEAIDAVFESFSSCEGSTNKRGIIGSGEVSLGMALLNRDIPIFSLHTRVMIRNVVEAGYFAIAAAKPRYNEETRSRLHPALIIQPLNPTFHDLNPCLAVFVKFGGAVLAFGGVPDVVVLRVEQLTLLQPYGRALCAGFEVVKELISSVHCSWLSMNTSLRLADDEPAAK